MLKKSQEAQIEAELVYAGYRLTKLRRTLISIFLLRGHPLSAADLSAILKRRGLTPHKVTLYRELDFLKEKKVITVIDLADGVQRFEYIDWPHHHHLVCLQCKKIEDVELQEDAGHFEKKIKTKNNFTILRHSLEFFGVCGECK